MIKHIDHVTYAIKFENEKQEISKWETLGLYEHVRLNTLIFPATHIALTSNLDNLVSSDEISWNLMTGLSISVVYDSPVNEFIRRYGEGIQHIAYNISSKTDIDGLFWELNKKFDLMTPILNYSDDNGAKLNQIFVKPSKPYGAFIEFVQRLPGENGKPYDGFDVENIENLYSEYDTYSKWLDKNDY
jgi:4-hydroxyphenylpyruvate dioxygenase-like putative hemolysin